MLAMNGSSIPQVDVEGRTIYIVVSNLQTSSLDAIEFVMPRTRDCPVTPLLSDFKSSH